VEHHAAHGKRLCVSALVIAKLSDRGLDEVAIYPRVLNAEEIRCTTKSALVLENCPQRKLTKLKRMVKPAMILDLMR